MQHLLQNADAIVAWHNVVGPDGVLCAASEEIERKAGGHYAPRAVDHIPYTDKPVFILTNDAARIEAQMAYRSALSGMTFVAISNTAELVEFGVRRALFLPYIRLTDIDLDPRIEWYRYGLPPELTQHLKHKARMHAWLTAEGFTQHTLNYIACHAEDIPYYGTKMLDAMRAMYDELGVPDYPLGVMVRGTQTDGNYGAGSIIQRGETIVLRPNGAPPLVDANGEWANALAHLRDHILRTTNLDVAGDVVMTRMLDIDVSPGMSALFQDGQLHCFDFNGQYTAPNSTACTGTTTFGFQVGARADTYRERFWNQTQALLRDIMMRLLQDRADAPLINGMLNIDMMNVGPLEAELWARSAGTRWRDNVAANNAAYAPRPYDPQYALFAEINPRETNWTLAMKAVLQALHLPFSVENLRMLAAGNDLQVVARDQYPIPEGLSFDALRENLLYQSETMKQNEEGVILRMPDEPAGLIAYTRDRNPARLNALLDEIYERLPQ